MKAGDKLHRDNCRTGRGRSRTPMPNRVIRVSDEAWEAAQRAANANDEYLSEAIRRMIERFAYGDDADYTKGEK